MGTWKQLNPIKFKEAMLDYSCGSPYSQICWEYQTCADILSIKITTPRTLSEYTGEELNPYEEEMHMCPEQGIALYNCLRNWIKTYQGEEKLKKTDEEVSE